MVVLGTMVDRGEESASRINLFRGSRGEMSKDLEGVTVPAVGRAEPG